MTDPRPWWRSPLLWTFVLAVVLLLAISGWLLTDATATRADALRTGGVAAGSVIALYALWLNDRRRQVEEHRQETERERFELALLQDERDRERVSDERFAKAVELLGGEADQVRVGALHVLAGLARSRPEYTQTVLDVLCAYLRRPWHGVGVDPEPETVGEDGRQKRHERQVRLTAQRLVIDLLPATGAPGPSFDLDLTGAWLEAFAPAGRRFGKLALHSATLAGDADFSGCEFAGFASFSLLVCGVEDPAGRFLCRQAVFAEGASFAGARFGSVADFQGAAATGPVSFEGAEFTGDADLCGMSFEGPLDLRRARFGRHVDLRFEVTPRSVSLYNTVVDERYEVRLPEDWKFVPLADGRTRIDIGAQG
ncbi:pentapeptide repeat-containing protein [Actinopolymorpha cephalotaxi]|uniref:Pentapeptide repeat-containing protein n=1 Tax=Actinopolymorpha cephalotaxi TaxID=504797 RepID=A0ABX2SAZ1_9ACTN|nr:pentapeptide repeat-containing protein [Actinopolymorpha cephalotaxi]NYH86810.1 hypothetical protein [Actinopolymorpha cephalotaxi]